MSTEIRNNHNRVKDHRHKRFDPRRNDNGPSFHRRRELAREKEDNDSVVFIVKDILHAVFKCVTNGEILVALFRKKSNADYYVNMHRDSKNIYIIKEIETDF